MILVCAFFVLVSVAVVNCQLSQIYFFNGERELTNNSYIYYDIISDGDNALRCVTGVSDCCFDGDWRDETGTVVHQGPDDSSCLYVTRGYQEISLNRNSDCIPDTSGLWRCDIPNPNPNLNTTVIESLYIYISNDNTSGKQTNVLLYESLYISNDNTSDKQTSVSDFIIILQVFFS